MNRIDTAIAGFRWVCDDEGTTPAHDFLSCYEDTPIEFMIDRMFPIVAEFNTDRDVRAFLARIIVHDAIGTDFMPATPFSEYMRIESHLTEGGEVESVYIPIYTEEEADTMEYLMDKVQTYLGVRLSVIYEMSTSLIYAISLPTP